MAKKKAVKTVEVTEEQARTKQLYELGSLARSNREPIEPSPFAADDPQRVEWERGWLNELRDECLTENLLGALQQVGVTTALSDLDQLTEEQAVALLGWIDHAPVDEHDGDASAAWLALLPDPLRLTGETVPADEDVPECRVIEFTLPPLEPMEPEGQDSADVPAPVSESNPYSDLPPSAVHDADLMLAFDNAGVAIDETQWRRLEQIDRDTALRWLNGRRIGVMSPVPSMLMPFSSARLKGEYAIYWDATIEERRRVLMPCEFGKPSPNKPEDGDEQIKMTVVVPVEHLSAATADSLFGWKRCKIEFSRRAISDWSQAELPNVEGPRRIISAVADVSGYSRTRHNFKFGFMVEVDELEIAEAFDMWKSRGSCRVEVLGEPITKKGDDDPRTPVPATKANPARPADDVSDTLPFNRAAGDEPLHPAMSAVVQALCDAGVLLPTDSEIEAWTDEERDEVLDWCKAVVSGSMANSEHFGGSIAIPECLVTVTAIAQDRDPIAFLFDNGPNKDARVSHECFCRECDRRMDIADELDFPVVCEQCDSDEDVERLGFYFEPNVNYDGDFIADLSEYKVPLSVSGFGLELFTAEDHRADAWRCGYLADLPGSEGDLTLPNVHEATHVSEQLAVEAIVGRMIDAWSKLTEVDGINEAVAELKQYLGQITSGKTPRELEPVESA